MQQLASHQAVVRLIWFIVRNFDDGLAILLGTTTPPSSVEIGDRRRGSPPDYGTHIDGGERVPHAQILLETTYEATVNALGGWDYIGRTVRRFRESYPETWYLLELYCLFVRRGGATHIGNGGAVQRIAQQCDNVDVRTVRRRLDKTIQTLALYLITREDSQTL